MIHVAAIADATLAKLVCEHRDNAGRAHRIVQRVQDEQNYADRQNGMADIYQELLDRRHFVQSSTLRVQDDGPQAPHSTIGGTP